MCHPPPLIYWRTVYPSYISKYYLIKLKINIYIKIHYLPFKRYYPHSRLRIRVQSYRTFIHHVRNWFRVRKLTMRPSHGID